MIDSIVLLRLAYLGVANAFSMLRLLPMTDRDKDAEILALRHRITVLERQLGKDKIRFTLSDRAFLAALLHRLPMHVLRQFFLPAQPRCGTTLSRAPRSPSVKDTIRGRAN
ncbi:hypothetical protein PH213_36340 [Streptomyces sp. SRF1]|nr:hypothetical protein [Streptomyces sp. SRF1]MDN3059900.1 hypothetical protein [Streptomyces sp. SRF1]